MFYFLLIKFAPFLSAQWESNLSRIYINGEIMSYTKWTAMFVWRSLKMDFMLTLTLYTIGFSEENGSVRVASVGLLYQVTSG